MDSGNFLTVIVWVFAMSTFMIGVNCSEDDGIPTNPCAAVLCMVNTTCIQVPDHTNCQPSPYTDYSSCPMQAMCVPSGVQLHYGEKPGIYCGTSEEKCPPGHKCDFVYPFCPISENPCLPMLACVPYSVAGRPNV